MRMTVLDELRAASSAEEFFAVLDVPYDPQVLRVARLHILRRMGEYLNAQTGGAPDRAECSGFLARAYDDFVASSPLAERVFKVHRDAVRPARRAFLSLADLAQPADGS